MRLSNGVKFNSKTAICKLMRITIDRRNLGDELNDIIANPGRVKGRELISYAIDYLRRSRESDDRSAAEYLWAASTLAVEALGAYRENQKIVSLRDQWMYVIYVSITLNKPELLQWWRTALAVRLGYEESSIPSEEIRLARKDIENLVSFVASIVK